MLKSQLTIRIDFFKESDMVLFYFRFRATTPVQADMFWFPHMTLDFNLPRIDFAQTWDKGPSENQGCPSYLTLPG